MLTRSRLVVITGGATLAFDLPARGAPYRRLSDRGDHHHNRTERRSRARPPTLPGPNRSARRGWASVSGWVPDASPPRSLDTPPGSGGSWRGRRAPDAGRGQMPLSLVSGLTAAALCVGRVWRLSAHHVQVGFRTEATLCAAEEIAGTAPVRPRARRLGPDAAQGVRDRNAAAGIPLLRRLPCSRERLHRLGATAA